MSFTNGAHNFSIGNANFVNVHGDNITHIYQQKPLGPAAILDRERATEATHKSRTASYAPKYNPKTRKQVIADMMRWVGAPPALKSILWFDGPAGAGKTCIMREVVACCEKMPGAVAASYFFSTRMAELGDERPFIATIAHQLAHSKIPGLKSAIIQAVSENLSIFRDGLESQMEALVVEPLQACGFSGPSLAPSRKVVIVVDGLDECHEKLERKHLLTLLLTLVTKLSPYLVVIIASRPELDIRMTFHLSEFKAVTNVMRLHEYDGTGDVRIFYCDEFQKIRQTHPLRRYIPESWLTEEILQALITRSSGNFIYPAVITKYIASHPRRNPVKLLEEAIGASPPTGANSPLAELDALYTLILHPPEVDFPLMRRILHFLIAMTTSPLASNTCYAEPAFLNEFLQLPPASVEATFCDLHSILQIPPPDSTYKPIRIHHKSLEDFLLSPHRSKDLFRTPYETHVDIALACIDHLQSWEKCPENSRDTRRPVRYAIQPWMTIMQGFLRENSTRSLPNAILTFDPRCIWAFFFVEEGLKSIDIRMKNIYSEFHENHCAGIPKSECPPLCKALRRMRNCEGSVLSFAQLFREEVPRPVVWVGTVETFMKQTRLDNLYAFKLKTGLYDIPPEQDEVATAFARRHMLPRFGGSSIYAEGGSIRWFD